MNILKKLLISITLVFVILSASAQNSKRSWDSGPLTWDDFHVIPQTAAEKSYLSYYIGYMPQKTNIDGITYSYYEAVAYINTNASWVGAMYRNDATLKYNQLIFDMVELSRRHLQRNMNNACSPNDFGALLEQESARLSTRIEQFRQLSHDGEDSEAMSAYENQLRHEMEMNTVKAMPTYGSDTWWCCGLFTGLGTIANTGSLGTLFPFDGLQWNFGLFFGYKNHNMFLSPAFGGMKAHENRDYNGRQFVDGKRYESFCVNFEYGYRMVDNKAFFLMPTVGLGVREYSEASNDDGFSYARPCPTIGVFFAKHFNQWFESPHCQFLRQTGGKVSMLTQWSIYGKLNLNYVSFPKIEGKPSGIGIMLQVGILFGGTCKYTRL